jgi:hypothetical protein
MISESSLGLTPLSERQVETVGHLDCLIRGDQAGDVSVSGNREMKSRAVLLSIKVAVSTRSLILNLIFILSACLVAVSASGSGEDPSVALLPAPQAK